VTQDVSRFRWRLFAACVLLTGLAMTQSPGLLVADTKLDLAIAPLDFLARAAHLWDGEGAFGQLQNQAYGYLWPMGPFFVLGDLLDAPAWVVQRLWLALVMVVAFLGAAVVSRQLGVRSDLACVLAGFAYALSPRMLTTLGPISIEAWPSALAPWVLLPLVIGAERGSPRRAAALSALAIAMVGGVNAAATAAVLPVAAVWLLTRSRGARRRSLMVWWPVFTLLGTLWWLVPLFLLGTYSPPFLDFIESAAVTTYPTTLTDALRGTSNWVPYVDQESRAGRDLITEFYVPMNHAVVLAVGLAGMALPLHRRHRLFLVSGLTVGLFLVSMGHHGAVQGWWAGDLRVLLDGVLAPLRNVHKFDPVIRLPLVIGLAFAVDELQARRRAARSDERRGRGASERTSTAMAVGIIILAVIGSASPAVIGRIAPGQTFPDVPQYWDQAASWLEDNEEGVALLVPGSSFGTYVWGDPRDEPLQALASSPWAVRNAVPLTPAGNIRMLDEVERRLNEGMGSPGLASYLRRSGVSHVVVRNDLVRDADVADPVLVHQALETTPGVSRVATFGPDIGGEARIEGELGKALVNSGWQAEYPAVEIYRVAGTAAYATAAPAEPTVLVGGPEDLVDTADAGVLDETPVRLAVDASLDETVGQVVLTDGLRSVERSFGRLHDAVSPTLTEQDRTDLGERTADYELDPSGRWSTVARVEGARSVTAASSQAEAGSLGGARRGLLPEGAVDGDPTTRWRSSAFSDEPQWWRIDFEAPRELGRVSVTVGEAGNEILTVSTPGWTSDPLRFESGETRVVEVPGDDATSLQVDDVSGRESNQLELVEVDVGRPVVRRLELPTVPEAWGDADVLLVRRLGDGRTGCASVEDQVRCAEHKAVPAEEANDVHRRFTMGSSRGMPARLTVRPRAGDALDAVALRGQPLFVRASTTAVDDPRAGAMAAVDGDTATTWTAVAGEVNPELQVSWLGERTVAGLGMSVAPEVAARLPERLELSWPGGTRTVELEDGAVRFPGIRTSRLTIRVLDAEPATDLDFDGGARSVPIGIGELALDGVPYLPVALSEDALRTRCGEGPDIRVNGVLISTRVVGSPAAMLAGDAMRAELCRQSLVPVRAGTNDLDILASEAFRPESLVLGEPAPEVASAAARTVDADAVRRRIDLSAGTAVATRENANPGWTATVGQTVATSTVYDGWRQGWVTPSGGEVRMVFAPDRTYRIALVVGALAMLLLVTAAATASRRRREAPALGSVRLPRAWALAGVLVVAGVLAGTAGVVAASIGVLVSLALHGRAGDAGPWWLGAPVLLAGTAYLFRPWGSSSGWAGELAWPHLLVVVAWSLVFCWVVLDDRRQAAYSRSAGRSTSQ
jgi:arabinofuranan 3-O-arabinosyltransferase